MISFSNFEVLLTIMGLHFMALISPGPDFVLTVKNSLSGGRKSGMFTALGFGIGIAFHVIYAIVGISILLKFFPSFFTVIKTVGALYIILIGIQTLRHFNENPDETAFHESKVVQTNLTSLRQGFFTNILNPKVTLFILGLFASVVPKNTDKSILILSGFLMVLATILWFSLIATFFGIKEIRSFYLRIEKYINLGFGIFFLAAGIFLIFQVK